MVLTLWVSRVSPCAFCYLYLGSLFNSLSVASQTLFGACTSVILLGLLWKHTVLHSCSPLTSGSLILPPSPGHFLGCPPETPGSLSLEGKHSLHYDSLPVSYSLPCTDPTFPVSAVVSTPETLTPITRPSYSPQVK